MNLVNRVLFSSAILLALDSIYLSFTHTAVGIAGQPSIVAVKNGTSGYIAFSSEL